LNGSGSINFNQPALQVRCETEPLPGHALASTFNRSRNVTIAVAGTVVCVVSIGWFMRTYDDVHVQWSEQVDVNGGKSIVISRSVRGNLFGNTNVQPENWWPTEYTIDLPSSSSTTTPPSWRSPLRPFLLELDPASNTWYLIAEPFGCSVWKKFGEPTPPYFQYTLVRNAWVQGNLEPKHIGRRPNLLLSPRFAGEEKFVSPEASRNLNDYVPEDSRPIIRAATGC